MGAIAEQEPYDKRLQEHDIFVKAIGNTLLQAPYSDYNSVLIAVYSEDFHKVSEYINTNRENFNEKAFIKGVWQYLHSISAERLLQIQSLFPDDNEIPKFVLEKQKMASQSYKNEIGL